MPWITLTTDHIAESLAGPELSALRTLQLSAGQVDPLPEIIARTCSEVQGYVATHYPVGQAGTIPDQLLSSSIAIARWRLLGRLPAKVFATESRRQEYEDAIAQLKDVAAGKFKLSVPTDQATDQPGPTAGGAWGGTKDF